MTRNCYFDRTHIRRQCHEALDYGVCLARETSASQCLKIDIFVRLPRQSRNDTLLLEHQCCSWDEIIGSRTNSMKLIEMLRWYLSSFPLFKSLEDLLYVLSNLWILNKLFSPSCFTNIEVAIQRNPFIKNSIHKWNFSFRLKNWKIKF